MFTATTVTAKSGFNNAVYAIHHFIHSQFVSDDSGGVVFEHIQKV